MAPKKKPAAAGGDDGDPFGDFMKVYVKKQKEFETGKLQDALDIFQKIDEGEEVLAWNFTREFEPMAFRVLFQSLRQASYNLIEAVRVWKCNGGDESVRSVCYYLTSPDPQPAVKDLHFTDNGITELGCEFLGKVLGPDGNKQVTILRLDYNLFGTPGVEKLSMGLSQNASLRVLSLCYCGIGEEGGQYLAHILIFTKSALEKLDLRGNFFGNKGIIDVFNGARRAKMLAEMDVFDNKFSDDQEVLTALSDLFRDNKCLKKYNLGGNAISDKGASHLVTEMARCGYTHLQEVKVTERCSSTTFEALEIQLGASKGKKKGKKK